MSKNDTRINPPEKIPTMLPFAPMLVPTVFCGTVISILLEHDENAVPFTTMTTYTLPENDSTYNLTENANLPSLCSVNMDYQGASAVEPTNSQTCPWRSGNIRKKKSLF